MTKRLKVNSPYDNHLITEIDLDDAGRVESALETAYQLARNPDKTLPVPRRIEILEKTADLVQAKAEEFARQSAEEGGKPLADSRIELARAVQGIREAAQSVSQLIGHEVPMTAKRMVAGNRLRKLSGRKDRDLSSSSVFHFHRIGRDRVEAPVQAGPRHPLCPGAWRGGPGYCGS